MPTKTLNAVLLGKITNDWPAGMELAFLIVTLVSEAAILFVAAQTGFLDGPRVLANMALDRWFPTRFSMLSDRLVTQNGVLMMSIAADCDAPGHRRRQSICWWCCTASTCSSRSGCRQAGMVRHWWISPDAGEGLAHRLAINGFGLTLTLLILVVLVIVQVHRGRLGDAGW